MRSVPTPSLALALSLALSFPAQAQTSDASIVGSVRDSSGAPLGNASVTVRNTSTGAAWNVSTAAAGRFAFIQLPLGGPYTVSVRRLSYVPVQKEGYELSLGSRAVIDFVLAPTRNTLTDVVVRAATNEERELATLGGNLRISAATVAAIPAAGRNFTDLASLAPTTGVQLSFLGQRWTSTDIRVDGAQSRNMLRAGEFGAGPFTLSMEAIREFDINSALYDVTLGRQGGGTVRAATKAGTNSLIGSIFSYYRDSRFDASRDYQGRDRDQREYASMQWGGSVGGPIVRDKAHFFLAFDRQESNEPLYTGYATRAEDELALGVARDSLDRLLSILAADYGLDDSRAQVGRLERRPTANTLFARVDWSLGTRHKLSLSHTLGHWNSPLSGGVDVPIALFEARSNYRSLEQRTLVAAKSTLSALVQNDMKIAYSASQRKLEPNSLAPRGLVRIRSTLSNGSSGDTRVQFGGNRLAPDDSREYQLQFMNTTYLQSGNVLWTLGTDNTLTSLRTFIAEGQSGLFEFNSLADLDNQIAFRYSRTLPLEEVAPTTSQEVLELGLFAQGEWRPHPNITTTIGVRWDATDFLSAARPNPLVENEIGSRTDRTPRDFSSIQPRAQFVWDIGGMGRDVVRGGAGYFTAQPTYYAQHNQLLNDGRRIADITRTGTSVPVPDYESYRDDPANNPGLAPGAPTPAPYVNLVSENFRTPSVFKTSAAYRRRIGERLWVTASVIHTRTTNNYMYVDRNLRADPSFTLDNEEERAVFVPASTIDAQGRTLNLNALASPALGRVLELTSSGKARQTAAVIEVEARPLEELQLNASYTFNSARDNTTYGCCLARTATTFTAIKSDPRDLSGSWGRPDTDFRRKFVISGSAELPWELRLSGRYVGSTGRPFSAVVNGDINGDESNGNDLAFVFDPDDPSTPTPIAESMRRLLANPNNVAREYLLQNLGRIASRNGAEVPWSGRVDVRMTKRVAVLSGQAFEIGVDVFNFANLLNSEWGSEYQLPLGISNQNPVVQRLPLLNVTGFDQATQRYTYTVNENFGVLQKGGTPFSLQLSLRYIF